MLDSLFTPAEQNKIVEGIYYNNTIYCSFNPIDSLNIQDYRILRKIYQYTKTPMHYEYWNDSGVLRIYQNDSLLVEFDVMEWFKQQIPLDTNLMEEAFEKNKKRLAFFDTGDIRVILSSLRYNKDTKKVDDVNIDFILIK